jgi:hypothetical protein
LFLRVVFDGKEWDGLDQPDDTPRPSETVYAYRQVAYHGSGFWDGVDKRGRRIGGRLHLCEYRFIEPQPDRETLRSRAKWVAWTESTYAAEKITKTDDTTDTHPGGEGGEG